MSDYLDELNKAHESFKNGAISEEEFNAIKAELLSKKNSEKTESKILNTEERINKNNDTEMPPLTENNPFTWFKFVVFKNYANFYGRATRKEYWMFYLAYLIIGFAIAILFAIIGGENAANTVVVIFALALMLPSIAVSIRRLHDINKSGWLCLLELIPIIGGIWFLVLMCLDSYKEDNQYGESIKY